MKEVEGAKGSAWFTDTNHNVFLDAGDNDFSPEHVRNRLFLFNLFDVWTKIDILAAQNYYLIPPYYQTYVDLGSIA